MYANARANLDLRCFVLRTPTQDIEVQQLESDVNLEPDTSYVGFRADAFRVFAECKGFRRLREGFGTISGSASGADLYNMLICNMMWNRKRDLQEV